MSMNIVLVEPEIPQNTGNIARTCAATGAVHVYRNPEAFMEAHPGIRAFYATTKAPRGYHEVQYRDGDFLFFGRETRGLPENLLRAREEWCIRIPMRQEARSLNLANSVSVVLYEALRQNGFPGLCTEGSLTGREEADNPWLDYV